ncbi:MAG: 2Fe-2S iron-sulfur cluster-binding protein [Anaerolineae bacterium]
MPDVHVTIDGTEISVPSNSTVLEAAKVAGIEIPTLCDHPAIEPIGACRMCLVEIEKQRVLQPACTFPVFEGMVVQSRSEKVVDARKFMLQLLFSERNHFCMFCQMSGSCELQDLAYDYELDHWEFERPMPRFAVDASRKFFVMDHNRCILCRRCIRVCDQLVGNGTLGLRNRGAETVIMADLDVPFGESSCISCGTCLQVCPTGALMDRASAYMGSTDQVQRIKSTCMACPVGCGTEVIVRENRVIRIEGDWDAAPNKGLLCVVGRFDPLHEERTRVRQPLVNTDGTWTVSETDAAVSLVADRLSSAGDSVATIVSGFVTVEEGQALLASLPGEKFTMQAPPQTDRTATVQDLDEADLYIVTDTDLSVDYQVAGMAVKRGVRQRGARLVLIGEGENGLAGWASVHAGSSDLETVVRMATQAECPIIISGPAGLAIAHELAGKVPSARLATFAPGGNGRGLLDAGYRQAYAGELARVCVVVAGETASVEPSFLSALDAQEYVVVFSSYREPWDQVADVILPMPTALEKSGTTQSADGISCEVVAAIETRVPTLQTTISMLSRAIQ